jgi:hypothetical protein
MSTLNEREALRRALHAAVDGMEPRADGLQRIQARLRPPRPLALAWADALWTRARVRVPVALEAFLEWLLGVIALAWERFGPRRGTSGGRTPRNLSWLRPAAALGVTVFIVAAGAYVAIDAQQAIFPTGSNAPGSTGGGTGKGGGSHGSQGASAQSHSAIGFGSTRGTAKSGACTSTKPSSGAAPSATTSTGTAQSSPAASPSGSSSGASPSPTVTDSSSPTVSSTAQPNLPTSAADVPTSASTSAAVGTLANSAVLARSSAAHPTPTPCATTRPRRGGAGSTAHPSAAPAVISFGKLDS